MKDLMAEDGEAIIGWVLKIGVALSMVIILLGIVLFYVQNGGLATGSYQHFVATTVFPHDVGSLTASLQAGEGVGYIMLGIVLLVMTPVVRVAISALAFIYQRDKPMSAVTLVVLAVLVASFYIGILTR